MMSMKSTGRSLEKIVWNLASASLSIEKNKVINIEAKGDGNQHKSIGSIGGIVYVTRISTWVVFAQGEAHRAEDITNVVIQYL